MKARNTLAFILLAALIIAGLWAATKKSSPAVNDAAEPDPDTELEDLIRVFSPLPHGVIQSPASVRGEARGNWYFEATFPIRLIDESGKEIVQTFATAQGDWMTTEFVPFNLDLTFLTPETDSGTLILENSNPSGLAEHHKQLRIPVRFK